MGLKNWPEIRQAEDFERVLRPDGTLVGEQPDVAKEELLRWHTAMVETRMLEEMTVRLQRRGVFSVSGGGPGEEAVGIAAAALQAGDWLHPSYRQNTALVYWGAPLDRVLASALGHAPEHVRTHLPLDPQNALGHALGHYAVFLGAHIPVATGTALSDKLNGAGRVSLAFIGEGATSEGDFHDGLGLAGVLRVPLVVVIVNNGWSISIPASRQTAAETFAQKAVAHGIPHRRVDGNDPMAVFAATRAAVDAARVGEGPFVIEAVTYRMTDHNTADDATLYRNENEKTFWSTRDPIARFEAWLEKEGLIDETYKAEQKARIESNHRAAMERALSIPETPADTMFLSHLNGDPGWSLRHQQAELAAELAGRNPFEDFDGQGLIKKQERDRG